jgi:Ran GTPase-activating protein (RanGAP) involved in mRNA processing and transport
MLKTVRTFVRSIVTDEEDGGGVRDDEADSPRAESKEDDPPGQGDDSDQEGNRGAAFLLEGHERRMKAFESEGQLLFAETLAEKRKLHQEKKQEFMEVLKAFDDQAKIKQAEVELELETEFASFFKEAKRIVKKTRRMSEAETLKRLGLETEDPFRGNFGFSDIRHGKSTMDDLSNLFRPRREPGATIFREDDDDFDVCWWIAGPQKININYDPLTEKEFMRLQRHYPGLRKFFARQVIQEDMLMDVTRTWLGDGVTMKLLAEYVWRHTDAITGFDAAKAKGFEKRHCLMLMQALKECRGLKLLNFDDTKMCSEGAAAAALVAKVSPHLEVASLNNCSVSDAGAMFWGLALATGCPNLVALDLTNCKIGKNGAVALAIGVSKHQNLKVLNLSKNLIDREGCRRLGEALLVNPILEELNLTSCSIGSRGASSLAAFIINPNCKLRTLVLSNNDIGRRGGRALAVGMSMNKSITTLDLSVNDLSDIGAAGFGICLQRNSTLLLLDLSDCDITDLGAASVAIGLKTNTTLRSLKLACQVISDAGCVQLGRMMVANPQLHLKVLDLSTNAIRSRGASALAEMLVMNRHLSTLLLNDNEIQDEGAEPLGEVLSDGRNKTLKVLNVSENPISEQVAIKYFTKAERRLVTEETARLDIVAQGTDMARNNLRGCGVIVLRTGIATYYAIFYAVLSLLTGWFDFASDIFVAHNTIVDAIEHGGSIIYAVLTTLFVAVPFLYVIVVFSLPESETDIAAEVTAKEAGRDSEAGDEDVHQEETKERIDKSRTHMLHSSSIMLGRAYDVKSGSAVSFKDHMKRVWTSACDVERVFILIFNITQTRIAYEVFLSWRQNLSTLALASIRLTNSIFESVPQSLLQLHIIMSTATLDKIRAFGGLVGPDNDFSVLILVTSVCFSVGSLSNTLSGLFEEKFVVNWKRVALANEELAYWIGFLTSYLYHFSHYLFRALTVVCIASIYEPLVAVGMVSFGLSVRLLIWFVTKSKRRKLFAVVSYLVGSAGWDTRRASRLAFTMEFLETLMVIPPLWMPREVISANIAAAPLAFQSNWLVMVDIIGPIFFTAIIYGTGAIALLLYVGFIERIHAYSDVIYEVDEAAAMELAQSPFQEQADVKRRLRRSLITSGGAGLVSSLSKSMYSSASSLQERVLKQKPHRHRFSKKKDQPVVVMEEDSEAQL